MSRSKKSRKPGSAPRAKPKLSKEELESVEKRVRKKKGKEAGNRQKEALGVQTKSQSGSVNKDPRIGNKTPIDLGGLVTKTQTKKKKEAPIVNQQVAAIRIQEVEQPIEDNAATLLEIEQDEKLQVILEKQDDGIELSENEVLYYNDMMDKHNALSEALGISDDELSVSEKLTNSEDDLWDKLDGNGLSGDYTDIDT